MISLLLIALFSDEKIVLAADGPDVRTFAEQAELTADQVKHFETTVRPLLAENCLKCHGAEKQWAGLRLDSRDAILRGGDSGPAAVAGAPESSLLVTAIRHTDENLKMPQEEKLSETEIAVLVEWIRAGLPFPDSSAASPDSRHRDPNHWSFRTPVLPKVPSTDHRTRARTDIDYFILAALQEAQLDLSPPADKLTFIRRVTFDLTGLPPAPKEISEFLADQRDDAWSRLIDRLLESPAYGEHWGRHWLDVARYADSNGLDENVAHGNAWRYRDYVVRSFNSDKPFDQFVREQLAGDLLPTDTDDQRHENLIATGFLSIGPKVLAEVNMPKMRMDIVDEQIDTVGRVFMGMTLGCARCHDHKFDPIDTADYYGLAGIFKSTKTMETYTKVAKWHEYPLNTPEAAALKADHESMLAQKKSSIEELISKAATELTTAESDGSATQGDIESRFPESVRQELTRLRTELAELEKNAPELPAAMGVMEDEIADVAIHVRGNPSRLGDVIPRRLPQVMSGPAMPEFRKTGSGRLELAMWLTDPQHPLTARVLVNRFWRWHFGEGLVRSTDNFGLLGEKPTHPELLDWLAIRFVQDGWSLKKFHRLILNSAVYRQGSRPSSEAQQKDPDNALWSRFPVRRLKAEEIRDSILFVSGQLDRSMGGSLLKVKNRGYLFDHTSIDTTDYSSLRRSLYLPVIRNNVYEMFQLMDFPDPAVPTGDRATTTVAPQALMMMNSDFIMQAADKLAEFVVQREAETAGRNRLLFLTCFGREPSQSEIEDNAELLKQLLQTDSRLRAEDSEPDDQAMLLRAWSVICHTLLASSEFLYVQ